MQKGKAAFKSPFQNPARISKTGSTAQSTEDLRLELQKVTNEIQQLKARGYREEELKTHIDKMHEYNEMKDIGQMVLGQIATVRGVCTRDLYAEYGLELED